MRFLLAGVALLAALPACASHPPVELAATDGGASDSDESLSLPLPDGGVVEWDGWAGEFVTGYCVQCHNPSASCLGSGCHPSNGTLPDFRIHSTIVAYAPMIRCGVSATQSPAWDCSAAIPAEKFPLDSGTNPLPTDEQRAIFVGWIDAGCP